MLRSRIRGDGVADLLINALASGLLLGAFYAAVTLGVSISFGMLDVVNIAHPAFIILGSYIAYIANTRLGIDPIVVALIMLPAFYFLGQAIYQVSYLSFEKQGDDNWRGVIFFSGLLLVLGFGAFSLASARLGWGLDPILIGVGLLPVAFLLGRALYKVAGVSFENQGNNSLRGLAFFFGLLFVTEVTLIIAFGVDYRYVEARYIGPTLRPLGIDLPLRMLVPACVCVTLFVALQLFLSRTFTGRAILAVSQDPFALRLLAIDPVRIKRIGFGISIATAALAGACLIIIQPVEPSVGREYIGRVFAVCVLGGMGSLPGTMIAALLLGMVENLTTTFFGPSWAPAVAFGFLLITLAVRPAGLLGR